MSSASFNDQRRNASQRAAVGGGDKTGDSFTMCGFVIQAGADRAGVFGYEMCEEIFSSELLTRSSVL
jgi:hypothetical protein